jgi:hypothetical protein
LVTDGKAGALDGVKVGDSYDGVIAKWGTPASGNNLNGLWIAGKYIVTVTFDKKGHVSRLGIGLGIKIASNSQ